MKVCFITGEFPPMEGGVGDYTKELSLAMAAQGAEVCVITSSQAAGASFPPLRIFPVISRWGWGSWGKILEHIRREKPNIIHIQYQAAAYRMHPAINFLPWRLRLLPRRPLILTTFHDLRVPYLFPKAGILREWVVTWMGLGCDAVIVTNVEDLLTLRRRFENARFLSPPPIYHIPIGSNIRPELPPDYQRDLWRARWGVAKEDILLGHFGFLNETKGVETLVRALHRLVREGYPVKLLMVGGETGSSDPTNVEYARRVKALIEELGLEDRVKWTGYTSPQEVSANLMACDICVLPYRDGVSLRRGSLHAALIHGLPIISTHPRVAVRELVDGENIKLVNPDDPEDLASAVVELSRDPALRQKLSEGARKLSALFGWEGIAGETLKVYASLTGRLASPVAQWSYGNGG